MENNNSNINKAPGDYEACTRAEVWANRLFLPCALKASLVAFCRATNGSKSLSNWPSIKDSLYPVSGSSHWGTFGKGVSRDHSCNGAITGREVVCDVTQASFLHSCADHQLKLYQEGNWEPIQNMGYLLAEEEESLFVQPQWNLPLLALGADIWACANSSAPPA